MGRICGGKIWCWLANDEVAEDPVQQNLMEMVLAEGIAVRFWTLQKVIDNIHRAADRQKILLVL